MSCCYARAKIIVERSYLCHQRCREESSKQDKQYEIYQLGFLNVFFFATSVQIIEY